MLPELVALLRGAVTVEKQTGVDGYGEPTYGAPVRRRARVVGKRTLVRNDAGDEVLSTHTVYLGPGPAVGPHDRVTLSTGDVGSTETGARQPPLIAVGRFPDEHGRVSTVLYLR